MGRSKGSFHRACSSGRDPFGLAVQQVAVRFLCPRSSRRNPTNAAARQHHQIRPISKYRCSSRCASVASRSAGGRHRRVGQRDTRFSFLCGVCLNLPPKPPRSGVARPLRVGHHCRPTRLRRTTAEGHFWRYAHICVPQKQVEASHEGTTDGVRRRRYRLAQ